MPRAAAWRSACGRSDQDPPVTVELDSGAGELYDLVNDPHEMDNLFDDAAPPRSGASWRARSKPAPTT